MGPVTKQRESITADLRVQFGVRVGLSSPDADLHDAVHILPDELVVIQQLHSLSRSVRSLLLQRSQQRLPQVVQVVQVHCLPAAQRPAAATKTLVDLVFDAVNGQSMGFFYSL